MRLLRLAAAVAVAALITGPAAVAAESTGAECPSGLHCNFVAAAYQQNSADPGDYGNYDLANRPADSLSIRFVVIHDTEESTTTRSRPSRTRTRMSSLTSSPSMLRASLR